MENIAEMLGGNLLSYGISGFALIMIGLTYNQMRTELKREQPRSIAIKTIWMFMALVLLSTATVGFFSVPIASKNGALRSEVDTLTVNMSQLTGLVTNYERALNTLASKLEELNNPGTTTPDPRPVGGYDVGEIFLNTELVSQYIDLSTLKTSKTLLHIKINDSIRKAVDKQAKIKLENYNHFIGTLPLGGSN